MPARKAKQKRDRRPSATKPRVRPAVKRAAPKTPAAKVRKGAKRKPAPKKTVARRPAAKVAARRAAPAPKPRAAKAAVPSRANAVRDLERGCDAMLAAIRGLREEAANRPIAPGKWTPREIVLHMACWDEWMLGVLPAAITRDRAPAGMDAAGYQAFNARAIESGKALTWDDVRELWATQRQLLLALLAAVPAKPLERWSTDHALGSLIHGWADHDRHHAAQIRAARAARPGKAAKAFTPAFAAQRAEANARDLLLFELQRARVSVNAALQGLSGGSAMRPIAEGKWSPHEIVLHLAVRDRVRLEEFDAVLAGAPRSWAGIDDATMAALNEAHLAPLRTLSWDEALRLLHTTREQLMAALVAVPAERTDVWSETHPFGAMMRSLPDHDRHHAEQIKTARVAG